MSNFILKLKKIILLGGDIAALYLSLYLTLIVRYGYTGAMERWHTHTLTFSIVFLLWLLIFFISDFYDLKIGYDITNLINLLTKSLLISGILAIALFYFFGSLIDSIKPQKVLIIDLVFSFILLFSWRRIFYRFIKSTKIANHVLIIGQSPLSELLVNEINHKPQFGYNAIAMVAAPEDLKKYCLENNITILISASDLKNDSVIAKKIFDCLSLGIDVYNIAAFYEQITNKIPVEYIDHGWFLDNLAENSKKGYEISKRIFDIVLSLIGLIFAIFLSPIIALIIKTESRGPVIFKQIRTGQNGKQFLAMKFRSMVASAEKNGPQWATKNDPRITRFGLFMRKTRLDEIPQLVNILKGEMSFIGPRPERPEFIEILEKEIPFYKERLLVKPGLAGWAQLKGPAYGGSKEESLEKIKYDLYYIKNRSLPLDVTILLKTIKVVLGGKGQ